MSNVSTCFNMFTSGKQMLIPAHQRLVEVVLHPDDVGICGTQCDVNCSPFFWPTWDQGTDSSEGMEAWNSCRGCDVHQESGIVSHTFHFSKMFNLQVDEVDSSSSRKRQRIFWLVGESTVWWWIFFSCFMFFQILFIFWWFILFLWSSSTYEAPCQGFWWRATLHANCCSLCVLTFYFDDDALSQLSVKHMKTIESPRQEGPWICKGPSFPMAGATAPALAPEGCC